MAAAHLRSLLAGALLCAAGAAWAGVPGFDAVRAEHQPSDRWLLDRHGEPIQRLRTDASARRGAWVALADVSPALRQALVLS